MQDERERESTPARSRAERDPHGAFVCPAGQVQLVGAVDLRRPCMGPEGVLLRQGAFSQLRPGYRMPKGLCGCRCRGR